jgi:FMN phosphatase YigB (HAD superfamily)
VTSTIVFDFDGTVIVGNGPVLAYAREMARFAPEGFLARAEAEIAAFEAGRAASYRDGYDVVGTLGTDAGVSAGDRQLAYLASRELLGSAQPADPAPGLADILARIPEETRVVLATNAPEAGVESALAGWGIRDRFDELIYNTGKPSARSSTGPSSTAPCSRSATSSSTTSTPRRNAVPTPRSSARRPRHPQLP